MFSSKFSKIFTKARLKQIQILHSRTLHNIPAFDMEYLCDPNNLTEIQQNISIRKGVGDINLVHSLKNKLDIISEDHPEYQDVHRQLHEQLFKIPNRTHSKVVSYGNQPKTVKTIGEKIGFSHEPKEFQEICKRLKLIRTEQLGNLTGSKSYYVLGELAELEHALIRYFVTNLLKNNYQLISVPDILSRNIIEGCGMNTRGTRKQVYMLNEQLHGPDLCLSGTSEMALAGFLSNKEINERDLPLRLASISRCYRAETSNLLEERGIYRVHEFTKVEMFLVSRPEQSDDLLEEILKIEEEAFKNLGLHFLVLDMPPHELGAQAYRKYDIEAWLHGRKRYGEISSCSNCLDYQSRRLGIKFKTIDGSAKFAHTLNGTACAIPRLLIALVEQGQNLKTGTIDTPKVLWDYMGGKQSIGKQKRIPELKLIKYKK